MSRFTVPTPTRGTAPSHAPPDLRYAPGLELAKGLGCFSLGLGNAELMAAKKNARLTGVHHPNLIKGYGIQKIVTGLGILTSQRPIGWMWGRVAGEVADLATIGEAMIHQNTDERKASTISAIAVTGVSVLDAHVASSLTAGARVEG